MSAKVTPWFSPDVKPVHVGWYEATLDVSRDEPPVFWWDGRVWNLWDTGDICSIQNRHWRGLVDKPEGKDK